MTATVLFADESLEIPDDAGHLLGAWHGPRGLSGDDLAARIRSALDHPRDFPPLAQAVVPGDRVVLAVDPRVPDLATLVASVVNVLESSGVDRGSVLVLSTSSEPGWDRSLPAGVRSAVHDPDDREAMAYLATTTGGRRVYLNREATDADFAIAIGRLAPDPRFGSGGPWGTLFPGLSDRQSLRDLAGKDTPESRESALDEAAEVAWLMGNQFQIGVVPGVSGVADVVAGIASSVRQAGTAAAESAWTFRVDDRADLVVVGVGEPTAEATWSALSTGSAFVRRGGKIVALSRASGSVGSAASRLAGVEGVARGRKALSGHEAEPDYPSAVLLNEALAWADLYLYSGLDADAVEDLGIVPLSRPEEARRLASGSPEVLVVSHAELTRASVAEDEA